MTLIPLEKDQQTISGRFRKAYAFAFLDRGEIFIEKNPHKKNSTALRSDLENLKTRMFKVKLKNGTKWDEFKKTEQFSKYVSLENQHKPKRS